MGVGRPFILAANCLEVGHVKSMGAEEEGQRMHFSVGGENTLRPE